MESNNLMSFEKQDQKKNFCDLCKKEIIAIDRIYFLEYGELKTLNLFDRKIKKGKICRDCCFQIDQFVKGLRK